MRNIYGLLALLLGSGGIYTILNDYSPAVCLLLMLGMGISVYKGQLPQQEVRKLDLSQLAAEQADTALADWEKARGDYQRIEEARRTIIRTGRPVLASSTVSWRKPNWKRSRCVRSKPG